MEKLRTDLKNYSSSFDVRECLPNTQDVTKIKNKLEQEENSEEYSTKVEYFRTWNCLSLLCFVLKDIALAKEYNRKVLDQDSENMIALSNKAWFFLEEDSYQECKDICKKLEKLEKSSMVCLVAKAEVAFMYARLGERGYEKARSGYEDILSECERIKGVEEDEESKIPVDNICIWRFGYALVQKRLTLNISNTQNENKVDLSSENYKRVVELYCQIIRMKESSKCVKQYQAWSYVDLGLFRLDIEKSLPDEVLGIFPVDFNWIQTVGFFNTALELCPDDVYVLERSGKYFRYAREVSKSRELLEKAVSLKGTSFGHHHLALTLRRQLDIDVGNLRHTEIPPNFKMKSHIKSPVKVKLINYRACKADADRIIHHLDKSAQLSFNTGAVYDKGLFYRQLVNREKALETFEYLIRNKDGHSSRIYLANAYEQAGFCIREMLNQPARDDLQKNMEDRMKMYFKSSIEIACKIVASNPSFKSPMKSDPTLMSILNCEESTKENREDLLFLHGKMRRHKEKLEVLSDLEKFAQSDDETAKLIQEKVRTYMSLCKYNDAVTSLEILSLLPSGRNVIDKDLFLYVYIEAGIEALRHGNEELARGRFRNAFEYTSRIINEKGSGKREDQVEFSYDFHIICNPDNESNGRKLSNIMNRVGPWLETTLNTDSERLGTLEIAGFTNVMKKSKNFAIIFDFKTDDQHIVSRIQHLTATLQLVTDERKSRPIIMIIKTNSWDKVPDMFLTYRTVEMDLPNVGEDFTKNEKYCASVKEILSTLAGGQ